MSVFLCNCYHPPKPCYSSTAVLDMLCTHINDTLSSDSSAVIVIAGDLNRLDCTRFDIELITAVHNLLAKSHMAKQY